ncbi:MAG: HlyD family efflux transporter periplasmic adaptor subunit [Candidatus Gracilibacteria bacterium]|nr:HlyD family efflux transporter periplasmic adaptor subunit [Candidatus Gracilibacteria bacterium]
MFFLQQSKWRLPLIILTILVLLGGVLLLLSSEESVSTDAPQAKREVQLVSAKELAEKDQFVTALGTVESSQQVDVRAKRSGQVMKLNFRKGQYVNAGDVIAELEREDLDAEVLQAQANVDSNRAVYSRMANGARPEDVSILEQKLVGAQQKLKELERGSRAEEVEISRTQFETSQISLGDAEISLDNTTDKAERDIASQIQSAENSLRSSMVTINSILDQSLADIITVKTFTTGAHCVLKISGGNNQENVLTGCSEALVASREFEALLKGLPEDMSTEEMQSTLQTAEQFMNPTRKFLADILVFLNGATGLEDFNKTFTDTLRSTFKSTVTSSQSQLESSISSLNTQREILMNLIVTSQTMIDDAKRRVNDAENAMKKSEQEFELKQTSAPEETIAIQKAQIRELEVQIEIAKKGERPEVLSQQLAAIQQSQGSLARAVATKNKAIVQAPVSGTLIFLPVDLGDLVNTAEIVATVANEDDLMVKAFITEKERRLIDLGADVTIRDTLARGVVTTLSPALDPQTKKLEIEVAISQNKEELIIGETVYLDITQDATLQIMRIPLAALKLKAQQSFVFIVNDDLTIQTQEVVVGKVFAESIELISGLRPDDLIIPVIAGLQEGQEVVVAKRSEKPIGTPFDLQMNTSQQTQEDFPSPEFSSETSSLGNDIDSETSESLQ